MAQPVLRAIYDNLYEVSSYVCEDTGVVMKDCVMAAMCLCIRWHSDKRQWERMLVGNLYSSLDAYKNNKNPVAVNEELMLEDGHAKCVASVNDVVKGLHNMGSLTLPLQPKDLHAGDMIV